MRGVSVSENYMFVTDLLRWAWSVGGKIFRVVPAASILVVIFTLASQVSALLAALLPLKVIILLGSERVPAYFPALLHGYERSTLILGLCITAVVFFTFHLIAEGLLTRLSDHGARALIARSRKLTLFDNQERTLSKAYQRFAGTLAGGVFIAIASIALITVYPLQALVVAGYLAITWAGLILIHHFTSVFHGHTEDHLFKLIGILGSVGFFITFGCIVADILLGSDVSVFWALFTLLLVRQVLRRCASFVTDLISLYGQRLQLNALLFQGHVYSGKANGEASGSLWSLADPQKTHTWISPLIQRLIGNIETEFELHILQSGMADLVQWRVEVAGSGQSYLVKVFGKSRAALARHEASLFTVMNEGCAPLGQLCLVEEVDGFHCHVFLWPVPSVLDPALAKRASMQVTSGLLALSPSSSLVDMFSRSRPMLWQRIDLEVLPRLELFAHDSRDLAKKWNGSWAAIRSRLQNMPLTLMTTDLSPDAIGYDGDGVIWACQWGRWSLEPVGAGWPVSEKTLPFLEFALIEAQRSRPELRHVELDDAKLAAYAFAFEKACQRQNYRTAVELLDLIFALSVSLDTCRQ